MVDRRLTASQQTERHLSVSTAGALPVEDCGQEINRRLNKNLACLSLSTADIQMLTTTGIFSEFSVWDSEEVSESFLPETVDWMVRIILLNI